MTSEALRSYDISTATSCDVEEISVLMQANAPSNGGTLFGEFPVEKVAKMLSGGAPVAIARRAGDLVGVLFTAEIDGPSPPIIRAMLSAWPGPKDAYLYGPVCIAQTERGRGVLSMLWATAHARLAGRTPILFIRTDNATSRRAHERLGMREVATFGFEGESFAVYSSGVQPEDEKAHP